MQLMNAVEETIPTPLRELDKPFLMPVEDVFSIQGRGTVATGRIETGVIKVGDEVEIVGLQPSVKTSCTGKFTNFLLVWSRSGESGLIVRIEFIVVY